MAINLPEGGPALALQRAERLSWIAAVQRTDEAPRRLDRRICSALGGMRADLTELPAEALAERMTAALWVP